MISQIKIYIIVIAGLIAGFFVYRFASVYHKIHEMAPEFWAADQTADCGLVLTGGSQRVREGIDLLARGQIRKLIISGVNPQASFAEIFPIAPFHSNVKEDDIILERNSLTTYGNMQHSVPIIEALKCRDVILITSSVHMLRAISTLRAELSEHVSVIPRSIWSSPEPPPFAETFNETIKVLFYSTWAF